MPREAFGARHLDRGDALPGDDDGAHRGFQQVSEIRKRRRVCSQLRPCPGLDLVTHLVTAGGDEEVDPEPIETGRLVRGRRPASVECGNRVQRHCRLAENVEEAAVVQKHDRESPTPRDVDVLGLKSRTRDAQHVQECAKSVRPDERGSRLEETVIDQCCEDGSRAEIGPDVALIGQQAPLPDQSLRDFDLFPDRRRPVFGRPVADDANVLRRLLALRVVELPVEVLPSLDVSCPDRTRGSDQQKGLLGRQSSELREGGLEHQRVTRVERGRDGDRLLSLLEV